MDYKRLTEIDDIIERLQDRISEINSGNCGRKVLKGRISYEVNNSMWCEIGKWREKSIEFEILRDDVISKMEAEVAKLKAEKEKILKPWWKTLWITWIN